MATPLCTPSSVPQPVQCASQIGFDSHYQFVTSKRDIKTSKYEGMNEFREIQEQFVVSTTCVNEQRKSLRYFHWWQRINACRQNDLTAKCWIVMASERLSHYDRHYLYYDRIKPPQWARSKVTSDPVCITSGPN